MGSIRDPGNFIILTLKFNGCGPLVVAMDAPRNFSWFVENKLAGMGYPKDEAELAYLAHKAGIKTLVNLTQTSNYVDQANELGISVHQIVIDDFCPPSLDQIQQFLSIVDNCKEVCNRLYYQRPG